MVPVRVITLTAHGSDELYDRCVAYGVHRPRDRNARFDRCPVCLLDDALPRDPLTFPIPAHAFLSTIFQEKLQCQTTCTKQV